MMASAFMPPPPPLPFGDVDTNVEMLVGSGVPTGSPSRSVFLGDLRNTWHNRVRSKKKQKAQAVQASQPSPVTPSTDAVPAPMALALDAAQPEQAQPPPPVSPEPSAARGADETAEAEQEAEQEDQEEPLTPRAREWCMLDEPPTPDRMGRVDRGSVSSSGTPGVLLSSIPNSATVETEGRQHTSYSVQLRFPATTHSARWEIERRYSEFAELHDSLVASLSDGGAADAPATVPSLPPTRWLNTMDAAFVESRRAALECWLSELLSAGSELSLQPQLHAFLETPDDILRSLMESDATPR